MTHASLCTGIGACELASTWMGWNNAFSCEINEFCRRVLKFHYPESKHYENIFGTDFSEWRGKIDILTAGFPCQPFSVAGARKGAEDDRYLWPEVLRVIGEVRPTWFIGENVAGITSMVLPSDEIKVGSYKDIFGESYSETEMRQQFVIDRICDDLEHIGYSVQPIIIPACAVGAPHRRDRIWFIAENTKRIQCARSYVRICRKERFAANCTDTRIKSVQQRKDGVYELKFTPNSSSKRLQTRLGFKRYAHEKEDGARVDYESERYGKKQPASDTNSELLANRDKSRTTGWDNKEITTKSYDCTRCWDQFPTQSPVCGGDDGIPGRLSDITVSNWITKSTKAFGNTIVPQVVFEIFKAIEEVTK